MGIVIIKKLLFCSYFRHISLYFYSNFNWESLLDVELNFASNEYPLDMLLMGVATRKTRNTWKNVMMMSSSHFFRYFLFFGYRGPSKVFSVGNHLMWNQILHPMSYPNRNWVRQQGDMSKIQTKKVFFSFLPPKLINIILLF